ncbi:fluoride efflux transporter CrcB [Chitinimonas lacunae]|uniref:Fluoride-specific ion channel FluC n=1 Tax=Chitinimonas lacunae TaxID=1963018 RepID=A0ABV8MSH1_9NEIS
MSPALAQPLAVASGAALGALLRWGLGVWLNPLFARLPLGTLCANLLGGYLIGVAVAVFAWQTELSPAWRLFAITGFLGGLTTFSTFSSEVVGLMLDGRWGWASAAAAMHLFGSLGLTLLGVATVSLLRQWLA